MMLSFLLIRLLAGWSERKCALKTMKHHETRCVAAGRKVVCLLKSRESSGIWPLTLNGRLRQIITSFVYFFFGQWLCF